jgi:hypothetical protein
MQNGVPSLFTKFSKDITSLGFKAVKITKSTRLTVALISFLSSVPSRA